MSEAVARAAAGGAGEGGAGGGGAGDGGGLRLPLRVLRCLGLWPARGRRLLPLLVPALLASKLLAQGAQLAALGGQLDAVVTVLCLMVTLVCAIFKALVLARAQGRLGALVRALTALPSAYDAPRRRRRHALLDRAAARAHFAACSYLGLGAVATSSFVVNPLLLSLWAAPAEANATARPMPTPFALPFDYQRSPVYEAVYVYDSVTLEATYLTTSTIDAFYVGLIIYLGGQMRILNDALRNVVQDAREKLQHSGPAAALQERAALLEAEVSAGVKQCVRHHMHILWCVKELEAVISPGCLLQMLVSMTVLCLLAFVITQTSIDASQIVSYAGYLLAMLYEIALYCFYGNEIIEQEELVRLSAFSCDWPDTSLRVRSSLKIIMAHAQKELKLTGYKFYTLSKETFLTLINGSYTFFAVLNQMKEK